MEFENIKHDWYQTDRYVCISLLRRGLDPNAVHVEFTPRSVRVSVSEASGDHLLKAFSFSHDIDPTTSSYKCTPLKVEIKAAKVSAVQWSCLEGEDPTASLKLPGTSPQQSAANDKPTYPTSHKNPSDWDKLAKEADEIEEGDPLNNLFAKIFKDANDDTKKAMIKSFTESGGTVLSTNWDEVGKGKVEVKPPDGMEYRKYPI
ncbi:hypothetical protein AAHC03_025824 [Spirometra sp. Aus1]